MITMASEKVTLKLDSFFDETYTLDPYGTPSFKMFMGGEWRSSEDSYEVKTPITGEVLAKAASANKDELSEAIASASEHRHRIRDIAAIERIELFREAVRLMEKYREDLTWTLIVESGKSLKDAEGEVNAALNRMKLTMEDARKIYGEYMPGDWSEDTLGKIALVLREPIGVVAAISPFNYPLYMPVAKIVPALLSGNAVVAKPPGSNPIISLLYTKILEEAGIPHGALQVITGSGGVIGDALVADDRIGMVSFTGSTPVGKRISTFAGIKKHHLELGGKGAAVVLEDASLDLAVEKCVSGSFKNAGQRCDAVSVIYVVEGVADIFVEKVVQIASKWRMGDPRDSSIDMGPVTDLKAAQRIQSLVDDAVAKGAVRLLGGNHKNTYFEPTVLDRVPLNANIALEETFGPVVTIVHVKNEDEALEIANKSRYGLDSCIFTNNFYKIWKMAKRLQTGEVTVNDSPRHGVGFFPFGGWKDSGVGREGIGYTIEEMTNLKTIIFNMEPAGLGKVKQR